MDALTETDFLRVRFFVEQGSVMRLVVQYEAIIDGEYYPVLRYDSSHDQAHRDILDMRGETTRKAWLNLSYADALTFALADVRANWRYYRQDFIRSAR